MVGVVQFNTCVTVVVSKVPREVVVSRGIQVNPRVEVVQGVVASKVVPGSAGDVDTIYTVVVSEIAVEVVVVRVFNSNSGDIVEPCVVPIQVVVIATRPEVNTELLVRRGPRGSVCGVESEEVTGLSCSVQYLRNGCC